MPDEINGKLDTLIDKVDNIEALLIGDLKDSTKVGLVNRVNKLEEWYREVKDDLKWIKRSFIGGIIAIVCGIIIYVAQNYIPIP